MRRWLAILLALSLLGAWPMRGKYPGGGATGGVLATSAKTFTNSIGFNTHIFNNPGLYTSANIIADMNYLGVHNIRDFGYTNATTYNAIGAAGGVFDGLEGTGWNSCTGTSTASWLNGMTTGFNAQVAANPGSLAFVEGSNEINNQPVCYLITSVATNTSSSSTVNTTTPASMRTVASAGFGSGVAVTDVTTPAAIPGGTTLVSATGTSVTLSNSTTVSFGDTLQFEANSTNPASGIAWQTDIYNAIHADSNLSGIPVLNFTDFPNYGVAGTAERNNAHIYATFGSQPGNLVSGWQFLIEYGQSNTIAGLPLFVTETGWYTLNSGTDGVDLTTQARYSLNALFDLYVAFKVPQIYFYEAIDEGTDTNPGNHYGLFDNSNNPKASATAIKNLTTILADPGGAFTPGRLNYTVTGLSAPSGSWPTGNAGGYSALFETSNGNFFIVLWNEPQIWNYNTQAEVTPPTSSVTISLGLMANTVDVYDPITGPTPINTYSNVNTVSVSLGADPFIVELTSSGPILQSEMGNPLTSEAGNQLTP